MTSFHFSIADILTIRIQSDLIKQIHPEDLLLMGAYLPGLKQIDAPMALADIELVHRQTSGSIALVEKSFCHAEFYNTWTDRISIDTFFLLYGLVRQALLEREYFAVHASCVEDEHGALLLIGHSGAGKTTVANALVQQGKRLFSGNKTIIHFKPAGELEVIAGTRTMTLPASVAMGTIPSVSYQERHAFSLSPDQYSTNTPLRVRTIALIGLNDGVQTSQILSPESALHRLVPFFLDTVNADVVLGHEGTVLTDKRPEGIESLLVKHLWHTLSSIPTVRIEGSLPYLLESISPL